MLLAPRPGREEQEWASSLVRVAPERQSPQSLDLDRVAVRARQGADEGAGAGIERVDAAVAEVTDQQRATERAKITRRQGHSPR